MTLDFNGRQVPIVGMGGSGMIVQCEGTAIKFALDSCIDGSYEDDETIRHEKSVYRRLKNCDGVVECLDHPGPGIQMVFMENGNLHDYLQRQRHAPPEALKLSWFRDMARHLAAIHDRRVVVADIKTRNFLLAADTSIRFSDFSESSLLAPDCDILTADDHGFSIYTDMGQLGAVMYEVVTGERCDFDLFKDQPPGPAAAAWPRREHLPSTQGVCLGGIIDKCWTKAAFRTCHELSAALNSVGLG
ncbi:serine/threonine protein kinase [Capronia epimyces CBS 606.96]|uniref:Serine/threonine protein kinase n=1 Tax=Capronia epimyces CBS 606.96 TaxID=1182542 RepID=W9XYI7_9EURO|nr:serine/threonine protein kinase [Capronia epimyces CBS 606.96]EXJ82420.1 serine/threonine protein kinase [Capronia epimyces CBS 606.96]